MGLSTQSLIAYGWKISALVNIMLSDQGALPSKIIILCKSISSRKTDHMNYRKPVKVVSQKPISRRKKSLILHKDWTDDAKYFITIFWMLNLTNIYCMLCKNNKNIMNFHIGSSSTETRIKSSYTILLVCFKTVE